jgi:hypothetical protein
MSLTPEELLRTLVTDPELTDADLEHIVAGKGGGGGGGGDPVMQGFNRLNGLSNFQRSTLDNTWRLQRNLGTNRRTYSGRRV